MTWHPEIDREMLRRRAGLLARIRQFFSDRGVQEVTTPLITPCGITDPNIDSLALEAQSGYLRTSPEFFHKRLLAAGFGDLYELGPVFRANERGRHHRREFWMLEWYRINWTWQALAAEVTELIKACCPTPSQLQPETEFQSWRTCMQNGLCCDPLTCADDELVRLTPDLPADCDRDMRLDYLFATRIQPGFADNRLTVVHGYPASQAALSRLDPGDERIAERFEVFWGQVELANGYRELTCPEEQRRRFIQDNVRRTALGRPVMPIDEDLLTALETGLPECAGVALGVERLLMQLCDSGDINQVTPF
jgi:elongation factor P--(R)-beta-lysine ligase